MVKGIIEISIALAFIALFSIAIVSYSTGYAEDNEVFIDINNDSGFTNLGSNIINDVNSYSTGSGRDSYAAFHNGTLTEGDQSPQTGTQFKVGPTTLLNTTTKAIGIGADKIFGNSGQFSFIPAMFVTLLLSIIGYLGWKAWRGNP